MPFPTKTRTGGENPLSTIALGPPVGRDRKFQPIKSTTAVAASTSYAVGNVSADDEPGVWLLIGIGTSEYGLFLDPGGTTDHVLIAGSSNVVAIGSIGASKVALDKDANGVTQVTGGSGTPAFTGGWYLVRLY